jgi:acetate kinase
MSANGQSTVLAFNPGSASLKFEIVVSEPPTPSIVKGTKALSGVVEPIGSNAKFSLLTGRKKTTEEDLPVKDHGEAAAKVLARMDWGLTMGLRASGTSTSWAIA